MEGLRESSSVLTVRRFGVIFAEGVVFGCAWIQEAQGVLRDVFSSHHSVISEDVRQRDSRELPLSVGLNRAHLWLTYTHISIMAYNERIQFRIKVYTHSSSLSLTTYTHIFYIEFIYFLIFISHLTDGGVLDPAEGNGSFSVTLTEAQQESSRSLIAEQGLGALLCHKSHNASVTERARPQSS